MSHDERMIDEYLDDRLSPEQRRAFEQRLQDDPQLARSVAALRGVGELLRGAADGDSHGETLDDDFYRRARGRFLGGGREPHVGGLRLLSWESAGLATAAMLAVLLFVPPLVTRELEPLAPADSAPLAKQEIAPREANLADEEPLAEGSFAPAPAEAPPTADRQDRAEQRRVAERIEPDLGATRDSLPPPPALDDADADTVTEKTDTRARASKAAA